MDFSVRRQTEWWTDVNPGIPDTHVVEVPMMTKEHKFNLWRGQWQENAPVERKRSPLLEEIINNPVGKSMR